MLSFGMKSARKSSCIRSCVWSPAAVRLPMRGSPSRPEAADVLSQMERTDPLDEEYAEAFDTLRSVVLEHAGSEELFVFPLLRQLDQDGLLLEMGRRYREIRDSPSPAQQPCDVEQLAALLRQRAPHVARSSLSSTVRPRSNGARNTDNTPSPVAEVGTALVYLEPPNFV